MVEYIYYFTDDGCPHLAAEPKYFTHFYKSKSGAWRYWELPHKPLYYQTADGNWRCRVVTFVKGEATDEPCAAPAFSKPGFVRPPRPPRITRAERKRLAKASAEADAIDEEFEDSE